MVGLGGSMSLLGFYGGLWGGMSLLGFYGEVWRWYEFNQVLWWALEVV